MSRYITETIATFFLIFCGTGAMTINAETHGMISHFGVATAWGLIVMIMIFAFGNKSGAHMNPVVTLTFVVLKIHPKKDLLPYLIAQFMGAVTASYSLRLMFPQSELLGASLPQGSEMQSLVMEIILTFLLLLVILMTSQGDSYQKRWAPVAIGMTVGLEALFAGPISNASMNPFRSLAPALASGHLEHLWVYIVATTIGALLAGVYWFWQSGATRLKKKKV